MRIFQKFCAFLLVLSIVACATPSPEPAKDHLTLTPATFSDLAGWSTDHIADALPALARSCPTLRKKSADWVAPCAALSSVPAHDDDSARQFFERYFQPYAASGDNGSDGLFTGYYEAELRGSATRLGPYQTPLYARPRDMIAVDLGLFKAEWAGKKLTGKIQKNALIPYDDRSQIVRNGLTNRADILAWVDDPVDAFVLAIQGSGRVRMADGSVLRVGYDGANGRDYVAIGRVLAEAGDLPRPVTMPAIRAWLAAHPDRAEDVMNRNPSYVFFRTLTTDSPIGAAGVPLTPQRSLAVDPAFISLGTPLWLDTTDGHGAPLQRLVIAQDTGGAIKGPVRGDVFWGFGTEAERQAGLMQSRGRYFVLRPKE